MKKIGVIDVGSRSVRLVVYDIIYGVGGCYRTSIIFNDKVFCELVRGMSITGFLNPDGRLVAHNAVNRFVGLATKLSLDDLIVFTTYAVRNAVDGKDFVRKLEHDNGIDIMIMDGHAEAHYAAIGTMTYIGELDGVVGDLGGGSLEFAMVNKSKVLKCSSLPLGSGMFENSGWNPEQVATINSLLQEINFRSDLREREFYAVGGGFRSLAKVHMEYVKYPLKVINHYRVSRTELCRFLSEMKHISEHEYDCVAGLSAKRVGAFANVMMIMEQILNVGEPKSVVFSGFGVREGVMLERIGMIGDCANVLLNSCYVLIDAEEKRKIYAAELHKCTAEMLVRDLFPEMRLVACLLSNIAVNYHTAFRARIAFEIVFTTSILRGIDHRMRVLLGVMLYYRYSYTMESEVKKIVKGFLSSIEIKYAQMVGVMLRFYEYVTIGEPELLKNVKFNLEKYVITITGVAKFLPMEQLGKRVSELTEVLGQRLSVEIV